MYKADLSTEHHLTAVGYLERGHRFPKGKVSPIVLSRLVALVERPFYYSLGYHTCDIGLCALSVSRTQPRFWWKGRFLDLGSTDVLVPGGDVLYQAPTLILHYIRRHRYLPPACFLEAVLNCPEPRSAEHAAAVNRIAPQMNV